MRLLLVRHGESLGNAENRFQGREEYPLTERGLEQARRLADRLRRECGAVDAVYSSPQGRALQTAECVAEALSVDVIPDPRLREYHIGMLTGLTMDEARERFPRLQELRARDGETFVPIPGEEGREALAQRVGEALDDYRAQYTDGQTVVVVSHGGALGAVLCRLVGLPADRPGPFRLSNASLSIVELANGRARLVGLNDTCHLAGSHLNGGGGSDD